MGDKCASDFEIASRFPGWRRTSPQRITAPTTIGPRIATFRGALCHVPPTPKICISATSPCHLYDLAVALHAQKALGAYHSGYPKWKLHPPTDLPFCSHSFRTLVTYGALRLPDALRPAAHRLFRLQDQGVDQAAASVLRSTYDAWIHAAHGKTLAAFFRGKPPCLRIRLGHDSGPARHQLPSDRSAPEPDPLPIFGRRYAYDRILEPALQRS